MKLSEDKYTQFKEYVASLGIEIMELKTCTGCHPHDKISYIDPHIDSLFKGFESTLQEKETEKQVKNILRDHLKSDASVTILYNRLKDGDYLK